MTSARISARLVVLGTLLTMAVLLPPGMTGLTGASSVVVSSARKTEAPRLLPCGSLSFALPPPTYSAGSTPNGVATGDFNNDGKADFAVASQGSNDVTVYLGDGIGRFTLAGSFAALQGAFSVAVGDFNRDNNQDLVVANAFAGVNKISVLLGNGDGTFRPATHISVGSAPFQAVVGDFNGDSYADIATANNTSDNVSVLLGDGMGGFAPAVNYAVGTAPNGLATGDFDNDLQLDIVTGSGDTNNISVLRGDGAGGFAATMSSDVGVHSAKFAVGDFNGDGKLDVTFSSFGTPGITVLLGDGTGSFSVSDSFPGTLSNGVAVADLDNDGRLDIAVANSGTGDVTVRLGNGAGGFPTTVSFPVGDFPTWVTTADFNGDGKADIVTANARDSNNAAVLLNNCGTPPTITCPQPVTRSTAPNTCNAVVTYAPPTVSDNGSGVGAPTCTPPSGSTFPKGVTDVSCSVSDAANHSSNCAFTVTVNDTQPPAFVNGCPRAISVIAPLSCPLASSQTVSYAAPAVSDNCPGASVACAPPSGSVFGTGTTTVTCMASDGSGNASSCSFAVQVWSACLQDESVPGNVCLFSAQTGEYQFCCNGVVIASGTGVLTVRGCILSITHTKQQRRVTFGADLSARRGTATVIIANQTTCQIADQNMANNSCQCPLLPMGSKR